MTSKNDSSRPLTVRIPEEDYEYLKAYAAAHHVSLNQLAAEAIAEYRSRVERTQAIEEIQAFQERLRELRKEGVDSVDLLHRLREARGGFGDGACGDPGETAGRLQTGPSGDIE
ncbi:MAG: type II toxin-antitoxin system HicB family antitoxin [Firmicutes bacterium]|nr:type II toxin-antitoxin system HicB family antitoxin [Bacillota bacterium]